MWYIYTMEYYLATKKNEIMPSAATQTQLEINILSEVRRRQITYGISYIWNPNYGTNEPTYVQKQTHSLENRFVVAKGEGWSERDELGVWGRCKL